MILELTSPTKVLLMEISLPEMKRQDIARTYALALKNSHNTDWYKVNQAIIARWSFSGLEYIKTRAWKIVEGKL